MPQRFPRAPRRVERNAHHALPVECAAVTIDAETQAFMAKLAAAAAASKPRHLMMPVEAREAFSRLTTILAKGPEVREARDLSIPVTGGALTGRLYLPHETPSALLVYFTVAVGLWTPPASLLATRHDMYLNDIAPDWMSCPDDPDDMNVRYPRCGGPCRTERSRSSQNKSFGTGCVCYSDGVRQAHRRADDAKACRVTIDRFRGEQPI